MKIQGILCYVLSGVLLIYMMRDGYMYAPVAVVGLLLAVCLAGGLIVYWQMTVARWLGCGIRYGWRDAGSLFAFRFTSPPWLVSFNESRNWHRKLLIVVFSGPLAPLGLLLIGGLFVILMDRIFPLVRPSSESDVIIVLSASVFVFCLLALVLSLLALIVQLRQVVRQWNQKPEDVLVTSWSYRYSVELGLYKIDDADARIEKCAEFATQSDDGKLSFLAAAYLHQKDPTRALEFYKKAFESPSFPDEVKWQAADGFITLALFTDSKPHLAKMDEYS